MCAVIWVIIDTSLPTDDEVWICKPTGRNQGKGIFLVKSKEEVDQLIQDSDERGQQQTKGKIHRPLNRIIQRLVNTVEIYHAKCLF